MNAAVLVTGTRDVWPEVHFGVPPQKVEWRSLAVLEQVRLPLPESVWTELESRKREWVVFSSPRAVRFWTEALLESGQELAVETRVACVGERTALAAEADGYTVDFCPREAGSEGFLQGFLEILGSDKQSFLLPAARGGREMLRETLARLGHDVLALELYESVPSASIDSSLRKAEWDKARAIVFTSPSSADAVLSRMPLPKHLQVVAMGNYTGASLRSHGLAQPALLPASDLARLGEVLQ